MKKLVPIVLIVIHFLILSQLRYEAWPEMLVIPHLQLNGFNLYSDMVYHYNPGLAWLGKWWFGLMGTTPAALKLLTWGIIGVNDLLIFLIARKKWGATAGMTALGAMIILQPLFDGNGLWYELAITPWLLLAFATGKPIFVGLAFLFKQSVFWFFPAMYKKWKTLLLVITAVMLGLTLWFWLQGSVKEFYFWAYRYIFTIFPGMEGYKDLATWRHWVLPAGIFGSVWFWRALKNRSFKFLFDFNQPETWMVMGIPLIFPRFGLFHLAPAVAFAALAVGRQMRNGRAINFGEKSSLFLYVLILVAAFQWQRLIDSQWRKNDRFLEAEVYQAAARAVMETDKGKPVLLMNGPEMVYVLADRVPPKPWLTQFSWFLELPGFQEYLISEFKKQDLSQVMVFPYGNGGKYVLGSYRPEKLLEYVRQVENAEK